METELPESAKLGRSGRLGLVCVSVVASVILSELILKLAWHNPYRGEQPEAVVKLRMHHANRALPIDRRDVYPDSPVSVIHTDSRGYIQPGRHYERPDATVAFLGGSTTECSAVSEELRFPALVPTLLEQQRKLRVNTLNAGYSGNNTQDMLNLLLNHVVFDRPDVVVLMEAANDVGVAAGEHTYETTASDGRAAARWLIQAASSRLSLVGALRGWFSPPPQRTDPQERANISREFVQLPTLEFEKRLRAFAGICRGFGIKPVLMTQPAISMRTELTPPWVELKNQQRFNDVVRAIAAEEDVPLVDLARHIGEVEGWDKPMRIFYDGIHVTDEGSRAYAAYIAQRLGETVLGRVTPRAD